MKIRLPALVFAVLGCGLFSACSKSEEKTPTGSDPIPASNTGGWTSLNSGHPGMTFYDVYFTDANHGLVLGDSGLILKTSDGGAHWTEHWNQKTVMRFKPSEDGLHMIEVPVLVPIWLASVYFTDALHGYAAGIGVYKTSDGGDTWTAITSDTVNSNPFSAGSALQFPSSQVGIVATLGGIIRTGDGGKTWESIKPDTSAGGTNFQDVAFTDANTGYVAGYFGLYKTGDAGKTWTHLHPASGDFYQGLYFLDANTGFAVGNFWINKTTDGGATWTGFSIDKTMVDVFFTDANTGYASGVEGLVMNTTNGGTSWTTTKTGTKEPLNAIHFPDAKTGYAVGSKGTIIKLKVK